MRILMIADRPPFPPVSGAPVRVYNLLRRVAANHEVWLVAPTSTPDQEIGSAHLRQICVEVETAPLPRAGALARPLEGLKYLLMGRPPDLRFSWSRELAAKIRRLTTRVPFQLAHIDTADMGLYYGALPQKLQERSVWMLHDIDWQKFGRIAALERKPARRLRMSLHSRMMHRWKPHYAERFSRCLTVSEDDRRALTAANPRLRVAVIPNGVDTHALLPLESKHPTPALLFVGNMGYLPCADAVLFFVKEILPLIRRMIPNVEMWIVGIEPGPEVRALAGDGIFVTGAVEDVRPYYRRSAVCVVPLRAGGGSRLKILEAMALGRPVVSTSIGSEGLPVVDGEHLLIADRPEEFANKVVRLLKDDRLTESITVRAREWVVHHYDWDIIAAQLMQVYADVSGAGVARVAT